jgi:hypothetical protein
MFDIEQLIISGGGIRSLQKLRPIYTSPPLQDALDATPEAFRSDEVIEAARTRNLTNCGVDDDNRCHIPFEPPYDNFDTRSKVGVVYLNEAFVDPRGYSTVNQILAEKYGLPVVVPIFENDLAFSLDGVCTTGRLELAQAEFPDVDHWVLAGHSFGGIAAMAEGFVSTNVGLAGVVLVGSYIRQDIGCGAVDFSNTTLPMALVTASEDLILNATSLEAGRKFMSPQTQYIDILGGNHGQFGSYNYSERTARLGQLDGIAFIPPRVQWELTAAAIAHVASRAGSAAGEGLPCFPKPVAPVSRITSVTNNPASSGTINFHGIFTSILCVLLSLLLIMIA